MATTSWAALVTIGSIMTASARAAAKPDFPCLLPGGDPQQVDEQPGDDGRRAGHGIHHRAHHSGKETVGADQVGSGHDAERNGDQRGRSHLLNGAHDGCADSQLRDLGGTSQSGHVRGEEVGNIG